MFTTSTTTSPEAFTSDETSLLFLMAPPCGTEGGFGGHHEATTTSTSTPFAEAGGAGVGACAGDVNCTHIITAQPGANIVSPILLSLTGVAGQVWALCYLYGSTRRQNARTVFYVLLCTLVWLHLLGKILTTPPAIISYAYGTWVGGKHMCDFHGFSMVLVCTLTHFTLAAMAVERFLGICHGYFYSRNVTPHRCRVLLLSIFVFCIMFSLLPLFNIGELFLQHPGTWCFPNLHLCSTTPLRHRIFTTTMGVINISNLVVIVVCNVLVVGNLLKMRVSRHLPSDHHRNNFRFRGGWDHELQMVLVLVAITCVAIVSWGTLDYILISNQFWKPHLKAEDHMKELRAVRLASVNQIADPWIYIIVRVFFKSRAVKCCRRALLGRGFSRRGEGSFHMPSLLQGRKVSRTNTPPRDSLANDKKESPPRQDAAPAAPQPPKTISAHKSSYYSDSGTGSYSGVDVPLVAGVEVPLVDGVEAQALSQDALLRPGSKGGSLHQTLSKSLSVVIPIPLFTSEQYRVAACGRGECGGGHYCLVGGEHHLDCFSRPVQRVSSSASACERSRSPFITVSDCEDTGVFRSKSWSCHTHQEPQPQYRTQSTQTLTCGDPSADEAPAAPQPSTHLQASLQPVSCETPLLTAAASQEHLRVADCGRGKLGAPQQQQQATPSPADFPKQFESKG